MVYPNIRIEMERGGFTINQLAARLGLPLNAFIYKLYGKLEFTLYEVACLADLFDCSLDYLVGHIGSWSCQNAQETGASHMDFGTRKKLDMKAWLQ